RSASAARPDVDQNRMSSAASCSVRMADEVPVTALAVTRMQWFVRTPVKRGREERSCGSFQLQLVPASAEYVLHERPPPIVPQVMANEPRATQAGEVTSWRTGSPPL